MNFLEYFDSWTEQILPEYKLGEKINTKIKIKKGETTPPKPLTEADLVAKLDENQIGTDSTIPDHIKKIQMRGYVQKKNGIFLVPTDIGLALVESYK